MKTLPDLAGSQALGKPFDSFHTIWRQRELLKRFEHRNKDAKPAAILIKGKEDVLAEKEKLLRDFQFEKKVDRYDGTTKLQLVGQDHKQSQILYQADHMWSAQKDMLLMEKSVRGVVEGSMASTKRLDEIGANLQHLRQVVLPAEEGTVVPFLTADEQVNAELELMQRSMELSRKCPRCKQMILVQYLADHVKSCDPELVGRELLGSTEIGRYLRQVKRERTRAVLLSSSRKKIPGNLSEAEVKKNQGAFSKSTNKSMVASTVVCEECGELVLEARLKEHLLQCLAQRDAENDDQERREIEHAARAKSMGLSETERRGLMVPQPPRDVQVVGVTPTTITLSWKPPIFSGGLPILDYLVQFTMKESHKEAKKMVHTITEMPLLSTTRFCVPGALASSGFRLEGMKAATEYINIGVYAVNDVGRSVDISNVIKSVRTADVVPPSPPLHLVLHEKSVTNTKFKVSWMLPREDGGSMLTGFRIKFTGYCVPESAGDDDHFKGGAKKRVLREFAYDTEGVVTSLVVRNLQAETTYTDIVCVALTQGQPLETKQSGNKELLGILRRAKGIADDECEPMESIPSNVLEKVTTKPLNKYQEMQKELKRVTELREQEVDAHFYHNGTVIRMARHLYIRQLRKDLEILKKEQEAKGTFLAEESEEDEDDSAWREYRRGSLSAGVSERFPTANKTHKLERRKSSFDARDIHREEDKRRRSQFHFRMQCLETELAGLEDQRKVKVERRAHLGKDLGIASHRAHALEQELDRANVYTGKFMDSFVLHNRTQRFPVAALRQALGKEMLACQEKVSVLKKEAVDIQHWLEEFDKKAAVVRDRLADRRAALHAFELDVTRRAQVAKKVNRMFRPIGEFFEMWRKMTSERKRLRVLVNKVMRRLENADLAAGLHTWKAFVKKLQAQDGAVQEISGKGSELLEKARKQRFELLCETAESLAKTHASGAQLDELTRSLKQLQVLEQGQQGHELSGEVRSELARLRKLDKIKQENARGFQVTQVEERGLERKSPSSQINKLPPDAVVLFFQAQSYEKDQNWAAALETYVKHLEKTKKLDQLFDAKRAGGRQWSEPLSEKDQATRRLLIQQQSMGYKGAGVCSLRIGESNRAVVYLDRARSLALEAHDRALEGSAFLGLSEVYKALSLHKTCANYAERALMCFEDLLDLKSQALAFRLLEHAFHKLQDIEASKAYALAASAIESEMQNHVAESKAQILRAEKVLIGVSADCSVVTDLEVVSVNVPRMRRVLRNKKEEKLNLELQLNLEQIELEKAKKLEHDLEAEFQKALKSAADEMDSTLIHGTQQRFEMGVLREKLALKKEETGLAVKTHKDQASILKVRISNNRDQALQLEHQLKVEVGKLMQHILAQDTFRLVGLNKLNQATSDVTGGATGGEEKLVGVVKDSLYVFSLDDGALLNSMKGDQPAALKIDGRQYGHHGTISSVFFYGKRVFSGGVDNEIRIWNTTYELHKELTNCSEKEKLRRQKMYMRDTKSDDEDYICEKTLRGHTGTVCCISADSDKIVSGSADKTLRIWRATTYFKKENKDTGPPPLYDPDNPADRIRERKRLRDLRRNNRKTDELAILEGHNKTVTCLDMSPKQIVSGSADFEIRIWDLGIDTFNFQTVMCVGVLSGHAVPITCVSLEGSTLISGANDGCIATWDTQAKKQLHHFKVHDGPVKQVQTDATKIVSAGNDKTIRVSDLTSGTCLTTLRGHDGPVLGVQFDKHRVLSVSSDATFRYWEWQGADKHTKPKVRDKKHILKEGEKLNEIAHHYDTTVENIVRWNKLGAKAELYPGMRLIVKEGREIVQRARKS